MSLARDWTRQLFGAWGAALLAPATMIVALAVLALGGSFGGLGALGQLLSGPAVPVGSPLPGAPVGPPTAAPPLAVVPATTPVSPGPTPAVAKTPAPTSAPGPRGGNPGRGGRTQRIASAGHGAVPPPPRPPKAPPRTPPPPGPPEPPPGPVTSLLNGVITTGEAVTSQLPSPVGAPVTGLLQSVGQTLNKLLPPL